MVAKPPVEEKSKIQTDGRLRNYKNAWQNQSYSRMVQKTLTISLRTISFLKENQMYHIDTAICQGWTEKELWAQVTGYEGEFLIFQSASVETFWRKLN